MSADPVSTVTLPNRLTLPFTDTASLVVVIVEAFALTVVAVRVTVLSEVMFAPLEMFRFVVASSVTRPPEVVTRFPFRTILPDWMSTPPEPLVFTAWKVPE